VFECSQSGVFLGRTAMDIGATGRVVFDDGGGYLAGGGVSVSNDVQTSSRTVNSFSVRCKCYYSSAH
jgi:hypothetical protein